MRSRFFLVEMLSLAMFCLRIFCSTAALACLMPLFQAAQAQEVPQATL